MPDPNKINLANISVVLVGTRYPENIGAAARAMRNMGIKKLILVDPQNPDSARIGKMATHAALEVVDQMTVCSTLKEALNEYNYVVGTTARLGGQRKVVSSPSKLAQRLISISHLNQIAVLFGPEDRGLTNEDIRFCDILVNIPTAEFSSLNLAQAVMVMCYELFCFSRDKSGEFAPRLANRHELEDMYEQLKDVMMRISFINPANPDYFMNNLRHFGSHIQLRAKEVSIIRGICRQINWYGKKRYQDGLEEGREDSKV
ncbi:MAG: RNA methyltransferase [bacterium]|nr:RNA methyltransferase [bacterium]